MVGSFVADPLLINHPAGGVGSATSDMFGGMYGGNELRAAFAGVILIEDGDVWVARIRLSPGATLTTSGPVYIGVMGIHDRLHSDLLVDETGVVGNSGGIGDNRTDPMNFWIRYREIPNLFTDGSVVYDVFVVSNMTGTVDPDHDGSGGGGPDPDPIGGMPDFNRDGSADMDDIRHLLLSYGACDAWNCDMDFNDDAQIDGEDISGWLDVYRSSRSLGKGEKKVVKSVIRAAKQVDKKTTQLDKKELKAVQLQSQLVGESSSTKRWRKITNKISKLSLTISKIQTKIEDIIASAAARM